MLSTVVTATSALCDKDVLNTTLLTTLGNHSGITIVNVIIRIGL